MNSEVARILFEIGEYLSMQDVPFKPRAYEKAARAIADTEESVRDIYSRGGLKGLKEIPGIGEAIALKIEEYLETGKVKYYEELKKAVPVDLSELTKIEGLGPKSIERLYKELKIKNLKDLEKAAQHKQISKLPGFGKKSEENILKSLSFAKTTSARAVLGFAMPHIQSMIVRLKKIKGLEQIEVAGSARRRRDTIGDVDLLAISNNPAPIMEAFVSFPEVVRVMAKGPTKSSVHLRDGYDVDLRVIPKESYGAALLYFTGSKYHNIVLRELAQKHGWKLNEYGLFKGAKQIAGQTEIEIYSKLGLSFIPPELRENTGEIEAATQDKLPKLIEREDLWGDLQVQSDWSDGSESIEDMARAAMQRNLKYIAITDHTKRLAMTNGLDEKRILKQMAEIDRLNKKFKGKITILKGSECDILKDGTLDLPDKILQKLDVVGASVHSFFHLSKNDQTERVQRAMRNSNVDIIFHPTNRIINQRAACELDWEALLKEAKQTRTALEIDAYPDRADLPDELIRRCVSLGIPLAIDSDAHAANHFDYLEYGISQARRGWVEKKNVVNAWPLEKMKGFLKNK